MYGLFHKYCIICDYFNLQKLVLLAKLFVLQILQCYLAMCPMKLLANSHILGTIKVARIFGVSFLLNNYQWQLMCLPTVPLQYFEWIW